MTVCGRRNSTLRHMCFVTVLVVMCYVIWLDQDDDVTAVGARRNFNSMIFAEGSTLRGGRKQITNYKRRKRLREKRRQELISTTEAYKDWKEAKEHLKITNKEPCFTEILSEKKSAKRFQELIEEPIHSKRRHRPKRSNSDQENGGYVTSSSLYLSGRDVLSAELNTSLAGIDGMLSGFTMESWLKPDGGQRNPATIFELNAHQCGDDVRMRRKLWTIGLKDQSLLSCSGLFVKMHSRSGRLNIAASSPFCIKTNEWTHVSASYDGLSIHMIVNGVTVSAVPAEIVAHMKDPLHNATTCLQLAVGCRVEGSHCYRGLIGNIKLNRGWKSQREVRKGMYTFTGDELLFEGFNDTRLWNKTHGGNAFLVEENPPTEPRHRHKPVVVPPCGKTVCDNPDVALTYATQWRLRRPKIVRYRFVNVSNDDGTNPMISIDEVRRQHNYLNLIFNRYNITWVNEVIHVTNTSLREKTIECEASEAGSIKADLSVSEYKETLNVDNRLHLNVIFANWSNPNSIGMATFPWDKEVFTNQGGTVVQLKPYESASEMAGIIHEFGHNLGLLHVHHGLGRDVNCDSDCVEMEPSMLKGDLCLDTNPTPINTMCGDPVTSQDRCGFQTFSNTPYSNFMSYADGSCQDTFTRQQTARMHCYLELIYPNWRPDEKIPSIPLSIKIVSASVHDRSVTIGWLPPLGIGSRDERDCDARCDAGKALRQFASSATSPVLDSQQSPDQATGPPDQDPCSMRGMNFWMALDHTQNMMLCDKRCFIEFSFETEVVPHQIRLWVTYGTESTSSVREIELRHNDGTVTSLGSHRAKCGEPLTLRTDVDTEVSSIRVYVRHTYTAVDAIEIISPTNHRSCRSCSETSYRIRRIPNFDGFSENDFITIDEVFYTDKGLKDGVEYTYSVQPKVNDIIGDVTSPVTYFFGQSICGDSIVQCGEEECDDGNQDGDDGCSPNCGVEEGFVCKNQPSECHVISEILDSVAWHGDITCSPMTSQDYMDVWASNVRFLTTPMRTDQIDDVTSLYTSCSDPNVTISGLPNAMSLQSELYCDIIVDSSQVWRPCDHDHFMGLEVSIGKSVTLSSVLIYVVDDLVADADFPISLIDTLGQSHLVQSETRILRWCTGHVIHWIPNQNVVDDVGPVDTITLHQWSGFLAIDSVAFRTISDEKNIHDVTDTVAGVGVTSEEECLDCGHVPTQGENDCLLPNDDVVQCPRVTSSVRNGTSCRLSCPERMRPAGSGEVVCVDGEWIGNLSCMTVTCEALHSAVTCSDVFNLQSVCTVRCPDGQQNKQVKCSTSGSWEDIGEGCISTCGPPPHRYHAVMSRCMTSRLGVFLPRQTCRYRCVAGYHVMPERRRAFRMTCLDSGDWSGPRCEAVMCDEFDDVDSGLYNCSGGRRPGSVCGCGRGSGKTDQKVTCDESGHWVGELPICTSIPDECSHPEQSHDLNFECSGYTVGKTCIATCKAAHHDVVINNSHQSTTKIRSRDQKDLVKAQKIIVCEGHGRWFPDLSSLSCMSECYVEDLGDGWCDPDNNRNHCNWDNGDCCASTTPSGKVEPFPRTCTNRCECKDPNSIEMKGSATQRKGAARALNRKSRRRTNQGRKLRGGRRRHRKKGNEVMRFRSNRNRRIRFRRDPDNKF